MEDPLHSSAPEDNRMSGTIEGSKVQAPENVGPMTMICPDCGKEHPRVWQIFMNLLTRVERLACVVLCAQCWHDRVSRPYIGDYEALTAERNALASIVRSLVAVEHPFDDLECVLCDCPRYYPNPKSDEHGKTIEPHEHYSTCPYRRAHEWFEFT